MTGGGLSPARLRRLHDTMAGYVERGEVPGLVTLVARRGEVHVEAIGRMEMRGGAPVRRDTLFRIASMSKVVASVAAMILVEECRLRLDDPVDPLLPELADRKVLRRLDGPVHDTVPANRPIAVRDVLAFTLGYGIVMAPPDTYPIQKAIAESGTNDAPPHPANMPTPDEWIRRLGTLPLLHQPGEKWMYNTGSEVLSVLVARAAGQPLDAFLHERIFEPLGMRDTGFHVPPDKADRLPVAYWNNWQTGELEVYDRAEGGEWSRPPAFPSGAGGLVSTVDDYLAFAQMLMAKGRHGATRILSRPSVETITADHLTPAQKAASGLTDGYFDSHGWGFGVAIDLRREDPTMTPGRYGWDGGLGTSWRNDPAEDLIGMVLTQRAWVSPNPPAVARDFWTSVYQAIDD